MTAVKVVQSQKPCQLNSHVISKQKYIDYIEKCPFMVYIIYTFLGSIFKPCYIQNRVIMNRVIKEVCVNTWKLLWPAFYGYVILLKIVNILRSIMVILWIKIQFDMANKFVW